MRTTSSLESMNATINRSILKRPHFFRLVERLQYHEARKANDMVNLTMDNLPLSQFEPRHLKYRKLNQKIANYTELLEKKIISIEQFLEQMASDQSGMYLLIKDDHMIVIPT